MKSPLHKQSLECLGHMYSSMYTVVCSIDSIPEWSSIQAKPSLSEGSSWKDSPELSGQSNLQALPSCQPATVTATETSTGPILVAGVCRCRCCLMFPPMTVIPSGLGLTPDHNDLHSAIVSPVTGNDRCHYHRHLSQCDCGYCDMQ